MSNDLSILIIVLTKKEKPAPPPWQADNCVKHLDLVTANYSTYLSPRAKGAIAETAWRRAPKPPANLEQLVWIADEDIDLINFDCKTFVKEWLKHRPAVSQPTVTPATQGYSLNHETWQRFLPKVASLRTRYIEQQSPVFQAAFLEFFFQQKIVRAVLRQQRIFNVAWGLDVLWCGAAVAWGSHCRVISQPVRHADARTLRHRHVRNKAAGEFRLSYIRSGFAMYAAAGVRQNMSCWKPVGCELHPWAFFPVNHISQSLGKTALRHLRDCAKAPDECILP